MAVLFPGAPTAIVVMGVSMAAGKLATVAWLARHWRASSWTVRNVLAILILTIAAIFAAGVVHDARPRPAGDCAGGHSIGEEAKPEISGPEPECKRVAKATAESDPDHTKPLRRRVTMATDESRLPTKVTMATDESRLPTKVPTPPLRLKSSAKPKCTPWPLARADSVLFEDQPEQARDLKARSRLIEHLPELHVVVRTAAAATND